MKRVSAVAAAMFAGNTSWNSVHRTRGGCSPENLAGTGGAGFLYCFAID